MALRLDRRRFLAAAVAASMAPAWARGEAQALSGEEIHLTIGHAPFSIDGKAGHAVGINGSSPGPLIRLKQGQTVKIAVTNTLAEETSIHWHGLLVPFQMDGVPGVSFPGIKPGETFTYEFPVVQAGTYWCHSHSGVQEMEGLFAPIIIDPKGTDPVAYDREHVVMLSDHSMVHPHVLMKRLKQDPGHYNRQKQTVAGLLAGEDQPLAERVKWAAMRMDPTDILDVNGSVYRYLVNGRGAAENWTGLFKPGERVRLRLINAGAMTIFNVRIPGLKMTVVAADGANVRPVEVDELQIANAETYDVIVTPKEDRAYTLVAEAADSSGMARATLAPRMGMSAEVPALRKRPLLTMRDMGMDMQGMEHHTMSMRDQNTAPAVKLNPGVEMLSPMASDRTGDRGTGLETAPGRVLTYKDLVALDENYRAGPPTRTLTIHLTGNMERFMWSLDGQRFSEGRTTYPFRHGERVRIVFVNDTMMNHPMHLHGHFLEIVNGADEAHQPLKHTVNVMPGARVACDVSADALGDWAFHCHMLLHMHAGMFSIATVRHMMGAEG